RRSTNHEVSPLTSYSVPPTLLDPPGGERAHRKPSATILGRGRETGRCVAPPRSTGCRTGAGAPSGLEGAAEDGEVFHEHLVDVVDLLVPFVGLEVAARLGEPVDELLRDLRALHDLVDRRADALGDRRQAVTVETEEPGPVLA